MTHENIPLKITIGRRKIVGLFQQYGPVAALKIIRHECSNYDVLLSTYDREDVRKALTVTLADILAA